MLKKILIGAAALLSVGGASLATATAADAAPWGGGWRGGWHGGYGYRGYGAGAVVGAGLVGLLAGTALAHPYAGPPPAYYAGPGYWGYYGGCRAYWRWDPYWGRYVRVERCY